MKFPAKKVYRKQLSKETDRLQSVSTAFLIASSLFFIAFGFTDDVTTRLILSILSIILNTIWFLVSWHSQRVIRMLTIDYRKMHRESYLEDMISRAKPKVGWRRPVFLIAQLLPLSFLTTWIVLFILHMLKLLKLLILF